MSKGKLLFVSAIVIIGVILFVLIDFLTISKDRSVFQESSPNQSQISTDKIVINDIKRIDTPQETHQSDKKVNIKIVECNKELELFDRWDELYDPLTISKRLQNGSSYSSQITHILDASAKTQNETKNNIALLQALLNGTNDDKFTNYLILGNCSNEKYRDTCSHQFMQEILNSDPNNAALWLTHSIIEAKNGNPSAAINSLEQALSAPNYNSYWAKTIEVSNQGLQEVGMDNQSARVVYSIGLAAAQALAPWQFLFKLCEQESKRREDIVHLCLDVGKKIAFQNKTQLEYAIGLSLQKKSYEILNDNENAERIAEIKKNNASSTPYMIEAFDLMLFDQELLNYWLEQLKVFGEIEAEKRLVEEAIRLSSDPDYNPCPVVEE